MKPNNGGSRVRNGRAGKAKVSGIKRAGYAVQIGLFAGLIWGALRLLLYYLGFTDVVPGFLVEPFFVHDFLAGTGGYLVGWAAFVALSVIASLLYAAVAFRLRGPWPGIMYGAVWFVLLFAVVGPPSGMMPPLRGIGLDTIVSEGAVFVLWGVFIGYSIAYEFTDERERQDQAGPLQLQ